MKLLSILVITALLLSALISGFGVMISGKKDTTVMRDKADEESNHADDGSLLSDWLNSSWSYRKMLDISNPVSGYQMKLNVSYDGGGDVSLEGHCNNNFSDLRFTAGDGISLRPYWIEEKVNGSYAETWVNTSGENTMYVYYNNSEASSRSNGTATFPFFEDFEGQNDGENPEGWVEVNDADEWGIDTSRSYHGDASLKCDGSDSDSTQAIGYYPLPDETRFSEVHCSAYVGHETKSGTAGHPIILENESGSRVSRVGFATEDGDNDLDPVFNNGDRHKDVLTTQQWIECEITEMDFSNYTADCKLDTPGYESTSWDDTPFETNDSIAKIYTQSKGWDACPVWFDLIFSVKHSEIKPSWNDFGDEEPAPGVSILSTTPPEGGTDTTVDRNVTVIFSKSMNTDVIPSITQIGGTSSWTFEGWNQTYEENDTAKWSHSDWDYRTEITLNISDYENAEGDSGDPYEWSFTTITAYDMVMEPDTREDLGRVGGEVRYNFSITNIGGRDDTYDLTVSNNSWPIQIYDADGNDPISSISIENGATDNITVGVNIPSDAEGETDVASLTVTSQNDPSVDDSANLFTNATYVGPFFDDFESDKGWEISEGEWERDSPQGLGGSSGSPDPDNASSGEDVLGYDLTEDGDYENDMSKTRWAISPIIDFSDYHHLNLTFKRWLNVESSSYDHAYIEAFDGDSWRTVWENPGGSISDDEWVLKSYDITSYASHNEDFQIRFGMGPTDGSNRYSGWNIDDLSISPPPPEVEETTPEEGATDVSVSEKVKVIFNKRLNTSKTPELIQSGGTDPDGWTFEGWYDTNVENDTVIWTHADWNPEETVTLYVHDYEDIYGNQGEPYEWSFTTGSSETTTPEVLSTEPTAKDSNVSISQNIKVVFDERMNTNVNPTLTQSGGTDPGGWTFEGWGSTTIGNDTAIWSHDDWDYSDRVTMYLYGYEDEEGHQGDPYEWSFRTRSKGATLPYVLSTVPEHDASNISVNREVKVVFSEEMNTSVTPTLDQTEGTDPGGWNVGEWSSTNVENDTMTWSHNDWSHQESITLNISGFKDSSGHLGIPYEWSFTTRADLDTPSAPRNLEATSGNGYVDLAWEPPSDNGGKQIIEYNIYRGESSGEADYINKVDRTKTGYTDTNVTNGEKYYYQVSAVNTIGEGELSTEVSATPTSEKTPPSAPRNVKAVPGDGEITLNWDTPESIGGSQITSYNIYRSESSDTPTSFDSIGNVTTYTDTDVTNGETYYYQVSAVNSIGESDRSDKVSATPQSEAQGYLTGRIKQGLNKGVSGAQVEVNNTGQTATTNTTGYFNITLLPGTYDIVVTKSNFEPSYKSDLEIASGDETFVVIYLDKHSGTLEGTVVDEDTEEGIEYASVKLAGASISTVTDEEGEYRIEDIPVGTYSVTASALSYENKTKEVKLENNEEHTLDFQLEKANPMLTGTIRDKETGEPLRNVQITIGDKTTFTNSTGQYSLTIEPGNYTIKIDKVGYEEFTTEKELEPGTHSTLDVKLVPDDGSGPGPLAFDFLSSFMLIIFGIIGAIVIAVIVILFLVMRKDDSSEERYHNERRQTLTQTSTTNYTPPPPPEESVEEKEIDDERREGAEEDDLDEDEVFEDIDDEESG